MGGRPSWTSAQAAVCPPWRRGGWGRSFAPSISIRDRSGAPRSCAADTSPTTPHGASSRVPSWIGILSIPSASLTSSTAGACCITRVGCGRHSTWRDPWYGPEEHCSSPSTMIRDAGAGTGAQSRGRIAVFPVSSGRSSSSPPARGFGAPAWYGTSWCCDRSRVGEATPETAGCHRGETSSTGSVDTLSRWRNPRRYSISSGSADSSCANSGRRAGV